MFRGRPKDRLRCWSTQSPERHEQLPRIKTSTMRDVMTDCCPLQNCQEFLCLLIFPHSINIHVIRGRYKSGPVRDTSCGGQNPTEVRGGPRRSELGPIEIRRGVQWCPEPVSPAIPLVPASNDTRICSNSIAGPSWSFCVHITYVICRNWILFNSSSIVCILICLMWFVRRVLGLD